MSTSPLFEYFEALERLKSNCPIRVRKGTKITKDSVSLEAGRQKGSIKKSRDIFKDLIFEIESASRDQNNNSKKDFEKLAKARLTSDQYRSELEAALAREISLLYEIYELKKQLAQLTGSNVSPLRKG